LVAESMILPMEKGTAIVIEEEIRRKKKAKPRALDSGRAIFKSRQISENPDFFPDAPSLANLALMLTCAACAARSDNSKPLSSSTSSFSSGADRVVGTVEDADGFAWKSWEVEHKKHAWETMRDVEGVYLKLLF
jgi:hypothetical protein